MNILKYDSAQEAIIDLEKRFPISKEHHERLQKNKEFYVLRHLLMTRDPIITYPIEIEHCGERDKWPDFLLSTKNSKYFVEVTDVTNKNDQMIFKGREEFDEMPSGSFDFTPIVKKNVEKKNDKYEQYKKETGITKSILLLHNNTVAPLTFSYGALGDELRVAEIKSSFDHVFLLTPKSERTVCYVKIS